MQQKTVSARTSLSLSVPFGDLSHPCGKLITAGDESSAASALGGRTAVGLVGGAGRSGAPAAAGTGRVSGFGFHPISSDDTCMAFVDTDCAAVYG